MTDDRTAGRSLDVPAVQLTSINKKFGPIVACDNVDMTLHRGRIHGILGENGAGKSTLMKILVGLVLPDGGTIDVDGERCQIRDPHEAADRGIGMVRARVRPPPSASPSSRKSTRRKPSCKLWY